MADGIISIRMTAAPANGPANTDVIRQWAAAFGSPESAIELLRGQASRLTDIPFAGPRRQPLWVP